MDKWKNHYYEMKGDVGMSRHENERNVHHMRFYSCHPLYIARASTDALIHWTLQLRSPALHVPTTDHLISPNETTDPMWHTHLIRHTESSTVGSVVLLYR